MPLMYLTVKQSIGEERRGRGRERGGGGEGGEERGGGEGGGEGGERGERRGKGREEKGGGEGRGGERGERRGKGREERGCICMYVEYAQNIASHILYVPLQPKLGIESKCVSLGCTGDSGCLSHRRETKTKQTNLIHPTRSFGSH